MRSLRPPGREFRITCLEDNVISFISPPSGVCMYQGAFVHVQHVLKQFIFLYARGILESLLFLHRGRGNGHSPFRKKGDFPHLPSSTPFCYQGRYNIYNVNSMVKQLTLYKSMSSALSRVTLTCCFYSCAAPVHKRLQARFRST